MQSRLGNARARFVRALPSLLASGLLVGVIATVTPPASAQTGPFTWPTGSSASQFLWCANLHAYDGCNAADSQTKNFKNDFDPGQVAMDGSGNVDLTMNSAGTKSGAINESTYPLTIPFTVSEKIKFLCTTGSNGHVSDWPAFWVDGSNQNTWPTGGEFDIVEAGGTGASAGILTYTYHYVNPITGAAQYVTGNAPSGFNACGQDYKYQLHVTSTYAQFTWNGTSVKKIIFSTTVPAPTDTMEAITDLAYSPTYAGPFKAGTMVASGFTYAHS